MTPLWGTFSAGSARRFGRGLGVGGPGQIAYTTAGTFTFTVPAGVTSICAVCIGSGASGDDGRGGTLVYSNNIVVTSGENLTVVVGAADRYTSPGQQSRIARGATILMRALGGAEGNAGGNVNVGDVINNGGDYGTMGYLGGGGSGAGGYSGPGGKSSTPFSPTAAASTGGGGGGGGYSMGVYDNPNPGNLWYAGGAGGGGVGIFGLGSNGSAGSDAYTPTAALPGGGGSGGTAGSSGNSSSELANNLNNGGNGGNYGGGGGRQGYFTDGVDSYSSLNGAGGGGAVRIIWGAGRSYPSNAANV